MWYLYIMLIPNLKGMKVHLFVPAEPSFLIVLAFKTLASDLNVHWQMILDLKLFPQLLENTKFRYLQFYKKMSKFTNHLLES